MLTPDQRRAIGRALRDRVAEGHSVEHWADASSRWRDDEKRHGARSLHVQKVAGISGSEAHLLSLLPRLRERGWDVRLLMLHEHEPGAWDFARALEARGVPLDAIPISARRRPGRVRAARRATSPASGPTILHTHLVHADAYGQLAGALAARAGPRLDEARLQRVPRGPRVRARRPRASPASRTSTSRSRTGLAHYLAETEGFDEDGFEIVHYGIAPRGEPPPYAGSAPHLLCVGRLIPIKGHIVLLRAFAEARKAVPGLQLDIAGRGPLEPALGRSRASSASTTRRASSDTSPRSSARSRRRRSSSCRRWARGSGWSRSRRWSAHGR